MLPGQHITEDTPADLLEGRMDLTVVLPSGRLVPMAVERRTAMMDLLIQVTTANKIPPGGHVIQVETERDRGYIPYKPNTPIGGLDAHTIHIVPKSELSDHYSRRFNIKSQFSTTFQPTFRLQVNLPRNQLAVVRVSKYTPLCGILRSVCQEKNLDPTKYELRHPANISERLELNAPIGDYDISEVTLVSSNKAPPPQLSAADLLAMRRDDKRGKTRLASLLFKKSKSSMGESSASSESYGESGGSSSRGASPSRSDESRSVSPPVPPPPAPPARLKKRLAPKPPRPPPPITNGQTKTVDCPVKRQDSDSSSGYHDSQCSLKTSTPTKEEGKVPVFGISHSVSNLSSVTVSSSNLQSVTSTSTMSISSANRKRRAPPPPRPPPLIKKQEELTVTAEVEIPPPPLPVTVEEQHEQSSSPDIQRRGSLDSRSSTVSTPSLASSISPPPAEPVKPVEKVTNPSPKPQDDEIEDSSLRRLSLSSESTVGEVFQEAIAEGWRTMTSTEKHNEEEYSENVNEVKTESINEVDGWEYTLPDPPTPFKDSMKDKTLVIHDIDQDHSGKTLVLLNENPTESSTDPIDSDMIVSEVPFQFQDNEGQEQEKVARSESTSSSSTSSAVDEEIETVQYKTQGVQCSDLPLISNFSISSYGEKKDEDWRNIHCQVETSTEILEDIQKALNLDTVKTPTTELKTQPVVDIVQSHKVSKPEAKDNRSYVTIESARVEEFKKRPQKRLSRSESFSGSSSGDEKKEKYSSSGDLTTTEVKVHPNVFRGASFSDRQMPWIVKRTSAFKEPPSFSPVKIKVNVPKSVSLQNLNTGDNRITETASSQNVSKKEKQNIVIQTTEPKVETKEKSEHEKLQEDYFKLQVQFMEWQQQLLQNQNVLQQKVAPQLSNVQMLNMMNEQMSVPELKNQLEEVKTKSLPRSGPPAEKIEPMKPKSATLDREESFKKYKYQGPPNVSLLSWEERPKAKNVKIESSDMYRIGRGQQLNRANFIKKREEAKLFQNGETEGNTTKVLTGSSGTPKGTTVVHLKPDTSTTVIKTGQTSQIVKSASKPNGGDLKPKHSGIRVEGFRAVSSEESLPKWQSKENNKLKRSSVVEVKTDDKFSSEFMPVSSFIVSNKNKKQSEEKPKVNIENVIKVPKTRENASVNVTHQNVKTKSNNVPPPPAAPPAPRVVLKRPVVKQHQPKLDPREELMIAIRNFSHESGLKKVSPRSRRNF